MSMNSFTAAKCLIVFLIPTLGWAAMIPPALPANTSGSVPSNIVADKIHETALTAVNQLVLGELRLRPLSVCAPSLADSISNLSDAWKAGVIPSEVPDPAALIYSFSEQNRPGIFSTTLDPASPLWSSQENSAVIYEVAPVPEPASWTVASFVAAFLIVVHLRSSRIGKGRTVSHRGNP
jgi:hypothetical protein